MLSPRSTSSLPTHPTLAGVGTHFQVLDHGLTCPRVRFKVHHVITRNDHVEKMRPVEFASKALAERRAIMRHQHEPPKLRFYRTKYGIVPTQRTLRTCKLQFIKAPKNISSDRTAYRRA
jgi:hypothetical protein